MTSNPWPSSDWVAFVSERGLLATLVLALALFALARGALRQLRSADAMPALGAAARLATLAAAVVAGLFDAVLLLAVPALIVWSALGALGGEGSAEGEASATPGRGWQTFALLALVLLSLGGMLRSGAQLTAMPLYASENTNLLRLAARIDPGNYRVRLRLARNGSREQRCAHAEAARNLFPNAGAAKRAARRCD